MKRLLKRSILFLLISALALSGCGGISESEPTVPETLPAETAAQTEPPETQPENVSVDTVPRYYQTDYPYIKFGNGTIATSGCSGTCLAMVATYMTDTVYTPDQMAYHFRH